ncbi:Rad9/Ddc1 [Penicillium taxi]|uniref:Rad9/Ddc1 n=1 Tax=Penicillium taxi TaxID=168475 RepID=UPI002545A670|nr:Rad9/Ddc1 [Penicillium taxi]KAJ5907537.1 Rad9/Ddc1 [Penicillium taxi]
MTTLSLSLAPPALVRLHDILICLSKFSDTVAFEAEQDLLRLSALNSTKTAFASFVCARESFFEAYSFSVQRDGQSQYRNYPDRFHCQVLLKALLSIFRGRVDRNKDTAVERCDMEINEDSQQAECRLTVKMFCGLGVIKLYKLTYEPASIQHAVFDRSKATSQWIADPRFLRQIIEHFSLSAEQLDMFCNGEKAVFTSFTTKIMEGKEILKHPVHTSVSADKRDFEDYVVEDNMHIAINLKDFKAVVAHAETANASVTARYTRPCKPLQLAYETEGVHAEFTMMTSGEIDGEGTPSSSRKPIAQLSRQTPAPISIPVGRSRAERTATQNTQMLPPPSRNRSIRPLTGTSTQENLSQRPAMDKPPAPASVEFDSLFVPADGDHQWDEMNEEEPQDILGWDASGTQDMFTESVRDEELSYPKPSTTAQDEMGIPPTQNMSQVRDLGLFD